VLNYRTTIMGIVIQRGFLFTSIDIYLNVEQFERFQQEEQRKVRSYRWGYQRNGILGIQYQHCGKAYQLRQLWQHLCACALRHDEARNERGKWRIC